MATLEHALTLYNQAKNEVKHMSSLDKDDIQIPAELSGATEILANHIVEDDQTTKVNLAKCLILQASILSRKGDRQKSLIKLQQAFDFLERTCLCKPPIFNTV